MSDLISSAALQLLSESKIDGYNLTLPSVKLERELYDEVNDILIRLGGKWKTKGKAKDGIPKGVHIFPYDPTILVSAVLDTGIKPPKNPTAFFPTPASIVDKVVKYADLDTLDRSECRILEPSGGTGAIAEGVRTAAPNAQLDVCEILPTNIAVLKKKGFSVFEGDFTKFNPEYKFDAIVMNPPFSLDGDALAWITHMEHAWNLLKDDGQLVAIVPNSLVYRSTSRVKNFRTFVSIYGGWEELPQGSFKESGTGVSTLIVWLKKEDQSWRLNPYSGWSSWHVWATRLWADNDEKLYNEYCKIFDNIRLGRLGLESYTPSPELISKIRNFYENVIEIANLHFEGITPSDSCWNELTEQFIIDYFEWKDYLTNKIE